MMKYWLIIFLFNTNGEFTGKQEFPTVNKAACVALAGEKAKAVVNKPRLAQFYCVTDDHHSGRKQDPGIPYD